MFKTKTSPDLGSCGFEFPRNVGRSGSRCIQGTCWTIMCLPYIQSEDQPGEGALESRFDCSLPEAASTWLQSESSPLTGHLSSARWVPWPTRIAFHRTSEKWGKAEMAPATSPLVLSRGFAEIWQCSWPDFLGFRLHCCLGPPGLWCQRMGFQSRLWDPEWACLQLSVLLSLC